MIDFNALSKGQKISFGIIVALIVLFSGYFIYALLNPKQALIYQDNSLEQLSKVTEQLEQQGIEYQLDDNGTGVMVNDAQANNIRVRLAGVQLGEAPRAGFELFDNVDYSMTEHAQKITYQRALQGELERTLTAYKEVEQARVHIMIPQRKLFSTEQAKAKASVSLVLLPGAVLGSEKVAGIQALIASSVEGLVETDVIVLNGEGVKISENDGQANLPGKPQTKGQVALEQQFTQKALNLMSLYFNEDQVAVSVSIELDHTEVKQVKRELLGDSEERGFITRKKESFSHREPTKDEPQPSPDKQTETEYHHGVNTQEKHSYAGAIKKLNVAIAIVADISEAEIDKIRSLVGAGLGLDGMRGDQLSVESFKPLTKATPVVEYKAKPIEQQPEVVFEPKPVADGVTGVFEVGTVGYILLGLLILVLLFSSFSKRKSLTQAQKDQALLQINQWLNDAKVERNAG